VSRKIGICFRNDCVDTKLTITSKKISTSAFSEIILSGGSNYCPSSSGGRKIRISKLFGNNSVCGFVVGYNQ
jgi:hypothetical protein